MPARPAMTSRRLIALAALGLLTTVGLAFAGRQVVLAVLGPPPTSGQLVLTNDWADRLNSNSYWEQKRRGGGSGGSAFGAWTAPSSRYAPPSGVTRVPEPMFIPSRRFEDRRSDERRRAVRDDDDDDNKGKSSGGTYRTLCVRLCDGYYFPVSFQTTRDNLQRDAKLCEKSCGSPARLFYYSNPGQEPEDMQDLKGKPYKDLKVAFLHRAQYIEGCQCKPQPWDEASLAKHRAYAAAAERRKGVAGRKGADRVAAAPAPAMPATPPIKPTVATAAPTLVSIGRLDGAGAVSTGAPSPEKSTAVQSPLPPRGGPAAQVLAPPQTLFRSPKPTRTVRFDKPQQTLRTSAVSTPSSATGKSAATADLLSPSSRRDPRGRSASSAALSTGEVASRVR